MKPKRSSRAYTRMSAGLIVAVIVGTVFLNLALTAVVRAFSLYLYTDEKIEHTLSPVTENYLSDIGETGRRAEIIFCMPRESLEADAVYNLVWQTARQLSERYGFIDVRTLNILTDPDLAEPYRAVTVYDPTSGEWHETGEEYTLSREAVIVASADDPGHTVADMPSFFVLNNASAIETYDGEEILSAMVRYAMTDVHPLAWCTGSHGEAATAALYRKLVCAGYTPVTVDLLTDSITPGEGILVVCNPSYDFYRGGEGMTAEIEKTEQFLSEGGCVWLFLDPLSLWDAEGTPRLPNLTALMAGEGITPVAAVLRDPAGSVTPDGYTLAVSYADSDEGKALSSMTAPAGGARVLVREAAALSLAETPGRRVSDLLRAGTTAVGYFSDERVETDGSPVVAAVSERQGGGKMIVAASYYLAARDALFTDDWGNTDFLYAALTRYAGAKTPLGATVLPFDDSSLRDLTMRDARLWMILCALCPTVAVAAAGTVVLRRRRSR